MIAIDSALRLLVICPHPDDETLGVGMLLHEAVSRSASVRIIFLTDGERNPIPQLLAEKRVDHAAWAWRRRRETLTALAALGVPVSCAEFWSYPDQRLRSVTRALVDRIATAIDEFRPNVVVAPSVHDLHVDHSAAATATAAAIYGRTWRGELHHLVYVIHGRPRVRAASLIVPENAIARARKEAALRCHATQLAVSESRMRAIALRPEAFQTFSLDMGLPPPRFRALLRVLRVLFERTWLRSRTDASFAVAAEKRGVVRSDAA